MDERIYDIEEPVEVPLLEATGFLAWVYANQPQVQITDEQHRLLPLPPPERMLDLVHAAEAAGFQWLLADGPRQQRPTWVLDLWWVDRPEVSQNYLGLVSTGCLALRDLRRLLEDADSGSDAGADASGRRL